MLKYCWLPVYVTAHLLSCLHACVSIAIAGEPGVRMSQTRPAMCSMQPDCAGSNITVLHFARHATWVYRTGDMRLELALKTSHDLLCSSQGKMRSYVRR